MGKKASIFKKQREVHTFFFFPLWLLFTDDIEKARSDLAINVKLSRKPHGGQA